jgi:hypothetical protein
MTNDSAIACRAHDTDRGFDDGAASSMTVNKAKRWTYVAETDYLVPKDNGTWVAGFLDDDGNSYECPLIKNATVLKKAQEVFNSSRYARVTVELHSPTEIQRQNPILVNIAPARRSTKK